MRSISRFKSLCRLQMTWLRSYMQLRAPFLHHAPAGLCAARECTDVEGMRLRVCCCACVRVCSVPDSSIVIESIAAASGRALCAAAISLADLPTTSIALPRVGRDSVQRALTGAPAVALLVTFRVEAESASDGSARFDAVGDVVASGRLSAALASGGLNVTTSPMLVSHVTVSAPSGGLISALLSAAAASPVIAIACGGGGALVVVAAIIYWARRKRRMCWRSVIITEPKAALVQDFSQQTLSGCKKTRSAVRAKALLSHWRKNSTPRPSRDPRNVNCVCVCVCVCVCACVSGRVV